jgi:hypothetical protein
VAIRNLTSAGAVAGLRGRNACGGTVTGAVLDKLRSSGSGGTERGGAAAVQALVLYAAALREQAYLGAVQLAQTEVSELQGDHKGHAAAALLLRRAAGIYDYLRDTLLSPELDTVSSERWGPWFSFKIKKEINILC